MNVRNISQIINKTGEFREIINKSRFLKQIEQYLLSHIAAEVREHMQIANYRQSCLVIQFDNASMAAHFRYQIPEILKILRRKENMPGIATIKIQVRPAIKQAKIPTKHMQLSENSKKIINQTANGISHDALANALRQLGR